MAAGIDVHVDLTQFSRQLKDTEKKFAAATRKRLRQALTESADEVQSKARANASWSSRIPSAVKVQTTFSTTRAKVALVVDAKRAPHARALELGNKTTFSAAVINQNGGFKVVNGRKVAVNRSIYKAMKKSGVGVGRALRHPVYDSGKPPTRVGEQSTRPFFFPAAQASAAAAEKRMEDALDTIARDAGFK